MGMRILQVHNRYQGGRGGEDQVMDSESRLLRTNGNEVHQFTAHNNEIGGAYGKLRAAIRMPYSKDGARRVAQALATYRPDIVHVHNFHYVLTPAIFDACRKARLPSVQTLHNFRGICANATFMREGRVCEDCMHGSPYLSVRHRCYEDSALKTLPIARTIAYHRKRKTWHDKVDRFIALTEFGKRKYVEGGYDEKRISVKPNLCYETFGLAIIEAFAADLPVIAARLGAAQDIISDGETGILFPPGDAGALAEAVAWAVAHPKDMTRMSQNARREYETKYTPEANYAQLIAIYEQTIREAIADSGAPR